MYNFTKGRCNVAVSSARCHCDTGRCATDPHGAGDVEALKCHNCSHRMWDHDDSLGSLDIESGIGSPPPYDESPGRNDALRPPNPLALPTEPPRSHYFSHTNESEPPLVTSYDSPRGDINLPQYNTVRQQVPRPISPPRTCTANLIIGIILGFVIVGVPIIAYRIVTS